MVMGTCVYHVAHRNMFASLGTVGQNIELENFTSAMYEGARNRDRTHAARSLRC